MDGLVSDPVNTPESNATEFWKGWGHQGEIKIG
jgi:hypothetical protein